MSGTERQRTTSLTAEFENAASWLSGQFALETRDLIKAYENDKESLVSHYNTAKEARSDRNSLLGWSVFWGVVFTPVIIYSGYRCYDENNTLSNVGEVLKERVNLTKGRQLDNF